MIPQQFPEANKVYRAPAGFTDTQVVPIPAFQGEAVGGSCDGQMITVVAWRPTPWEIERLEGGGVVYLTMFGGLAPHMLTTSFAEATHPA